MQNAYVVTGQITDRHTVTLDENLPVSSARVRVVLEIISSPPPKKAHQDVIEAIRKRQKQREHQAPSLAEVIKYLQEERDGWQ